ncbi:hypothetical protein Tco_0384888 [Tanacetum coccineum]
MERRIDEWSKSQNVFSERTNRIDRPPPPARTEHVNAIFTVSEKSDDPLKIQKDPPPPIIVNNKIEKDRPIKTSKREYYMVKSKEYSFLFAFVPASKRIPKPLILKWLNVSSYIVGIKRLLDDPRVTVAQLMLLVQKLLLLVLKVNAAGIQDPLKWDQQVVSELVALRNFAKKTWIKTQYILAASKVPMFKPGEYELWRD